MRRWPLRMLKVMALLFSALILVVSVGGFVVYEWLNRSVTRVHLSLGTHRPAPAPVGTQNWLLVGTDSRAGTGGEYGSVVGERSDTTILAHLDANGTTTNVSFPRDTLVTIPAYTDGKGVVHPAHKDKFNAAISLGGPSLLVRTVEQMTGIRLDHYVSVDLAGFKRIANALDGVEVCILPSTAPPEVTVENGITHVSTNLDDSYSGFQGHVGDQKVVGDQALAFVRQRHGLPDGDIDRIRRQQQFLGSVFREATQTQFLFNPVAVTHLLGAISSALTLDQHTSLSDLETLALRLRSEKPSQVHFETIPQRGLESPDTYLGQVFTDSSGFLELIPNGQSQSVGSVQILDQTGFNAMIAQLKDSASPRRTASSSAPPAPIPPSQVLVTVENGSGAPGPVSAVETGLAHDGFRVATAGSGDATASKYPVSQVYYGPGQAAAARTVEAAIPGSTITEDPSVTDGVLLVIGANYTTVAPVVVSSNGPPSLAASPTTAPSAAGGPLPGPLSAASSGNECTL